MARPRPDPGVQGRLEDSEVRAEVPFRIETDVDAEIEQRSLWRGPLRHPPQMCFRHRRGPKEAPLVIRSANVGGARFGSQHSQAIENWAIAVPGLKVAAPSNPRDVVGLLAAVVRSDDPVVFLEQKSLYPRNGHAPDGEVVVDELGTAAVAWAGSDATVVASSGDGTLGAHSHRRTRSRSIDVEVIDLHSLVLPCR